MTITAYDIVRGPLATTVTVTSDLSGTIYYHWYIDGSYLGMTTGTSKTFQLEPGDQQKLEVLDTNSTTFDTVANAPDGYPAKRTIYWIRSTDTSTVSYRVEQKKDSDAWETIGITPVEAGRWAYELSTPRLVDLASYQWRVYPIDAAGNDGTAVTIDSQTVVRTPDALDFAISFDGGTTKVTFSAAA